MALERKDLENMPFTVKDLQHEVYKARRLKMIGGDSAAMMSYFQHMHATSNNFYHAERVDDEGWLQDVFSVDGRSRVAYEEFGDVVCFDATYLTNEYELPFTNFVGVNHHGQSILLGCALVSREDCDTFQWIFKQWLCSMNNRASLAILTDQAAAMRKPLEEVMPNTRHRWCIWHIMRKIPEILGSCKRYKDFKSVLKRIVYESFTIMEFESRCFFDGFVNRNTKLFKFPLKYSKALQKRARDEAYSDANCSKYLRRLVSGFAVEKIFQKLYTDAKFQELQKECARMMYCICVEERFTEETIIQYILEDRVWVVPKGSSEGLLTDQRRFYSATFNTLTKDVICDCRKFQTDGIMCRHMIRVLDQNHVADIPDKYIVRRWRKDIARKHTRVKVAYHDPSETIEVHRYNRLMVAFESLCDEAVTISDNIVNLVLDKINNMRQEVGGRKRKSLEEAGAESYTADVNMSNAPPSTRPIVL
ncbi:protein FAR1-RELATED SEQUENCE 6-like [Chenopodium quinoa]|uniref:protein FAR1-RELATED SEQUENCE 6-like n=1 Tax=Chenopodium quinoa TaxID=63459 RepID=UPI000B78C80D|nr:protein FAR1-RELATED SEQUENCE 6-like [Chenopodium quinoa]